MMASTRYLKTIYSSMIRVPALTRGTRLSHNLDSRVIDRKRFNEYENIILIEVVLTPSFSDDYADLP